MLEKNSNCNYAEQIVSFLYGEIDDAGKRHFETHLQNCSSCAEELSDFSAVRSSVSEWRAAEFENLSTPVFILPGKTAETASSSWLRSIRGFFAFHTVGLSAAAMTAILVTLGLFWFFYNPSLSNEIAENRSVQVTFGASAANPTESQTAQSAETLEKDVAEISKNPAEAGNFKSILPDKKTVPVKNSVQKSSNETPVLKIKKSTPAIKSEKNVEKSHPKAVKNNSLPALAVDEYEDNSLRLSDILEEVSMK